MDSLYALALSVVCLYQMGMRYPHFAPGALVWWAVAILGAVCCVVWEANRR